MQGTLAREHVSTQIMLTREHVSTQGIEEILNRPITKFQNGDHVNVIVAELRLTMPTGVNKVLKAKCYKQQYLYGLL